jgi:hypothetical protein
VSEGPAFHIAILAGTTRPNRSVRVLSANLTDFKVCIIEDTGPIEAFPTPFILDRVLYSTARTRVYGVFGQRDILPLDIPGRGFISIEHEQAVGPVAELAAQFLRAATAI